MQGHFGADPHYMHWYNKYAWWYHVGHNNIVLATPDVKVVRIAYGIAGLLVKDRIGEGNAEVLRTIKIKFFDYGGDGELAMILEHLVGKVESARATEVPFHILSQKLPPSQVISMPYITPQQFFLVVFFLHKGFNSFVAVYHGRQWACTSPTQGNIWRISTVCE
jgi:hypothetical protein